MASSNNGGIVDNLSKAASGVAESVGNYANQASNYLAGRTEEAQKEAGKQAATSENTSIGQKFDGAKAYVEHGVGQIKADTKKEYYGNKEEVRQET